MVEYSISLDNIFGSLSDPTRRSILKRVSKKEMSVSEIAEPYDITLAAVSKHLKILEKAKLIIRRRQGKQQFVAISPIALKEAVDYLNNYGLMLSRQMDSLEQYLNNKEA